MSNAYGVSSSSSSSDLIRTAVVFLRSPQVTSASEEKKRLFLKSKSLTDEQIDTALSLAADPVYRTGTEDVSSDRSRLSTIQTPASVSLLGSGGGRLLLVVIFGGLSYAVYALYARLVAPFLRRQRERDEKLAALEEAVGALQVFM